MLRAGQLQVAEPGADLQLGRQAVEHPRVPQAQAAGGAEEIISTRSNVITCFTQGWQKPGFFFFNFSSLFYQYKLEFNTGILM